MRKLWYLIADANGLATDANLTAGQSLKIPNRVSNLHNDAQTNRPYNASSIIGDLTPTLPDPPPVYVSVSSGGGGDGGGCGGGGFFSILVIAIAVVVAIYAGPAVFSALGGESAALAVGAAQEGLVYAAGTTFAESAAATLASAEAAFAGVQFAAGAITGAVSNLAGQVAGNVFGLQDGINFAGIAGAALSSGLSAGLFGGGPGMGGYTPLGDAVGSVGRAAFGATGAASGEIVVKQGRCAVRLRRRAVEKQRPQDAWLLGRTGGWQVNALKPRISKA